MAHRIPVTEDTLVWRSYDAFNRRDPVGATALYAADCVWSFHHFAGWPDSPEYHGHDGLRALFEDFRSAWGEFQITPVAMWRSGMRFLIHTKLSSTGASSGVPVELDFWQVCASGPLIKVVNNYSDRDEALAAAGLTAEAVGSAE